jgi:hypothetical protein
MDGAGAGFGLKRGHLIETRQAVPLRVVNLRSFEPFRFGAIFIISG